MRTMYQKWLDLRAAMRANVKELHGQGKTPTQIAREIGMSPQRVYQIVWPNGKPAKAKAKAKKPVLVDLRALASKGGHGRDAKLSAERKREIARKAGLASAEKRRMKAMEGQS